MAPETSQDRIYGFVGLGQMGGPMAANIAKAGHELHVYDKAGTEGRKPADALTATSVSALCATVDTVFMSVPDGPVSLTLAREIAAAPGRTQTVVDLSTIGIAAAQEADATLKSAGVTYVDAPVSGGQRGAIAGTIAVMWAGPKDVMAAHERVLSAFCKNPFHVGDTPGQGQALKLLNNFLSATAMAATSEAVLFGLSQGLEMKTILDVVNVSTGQNTASRDKFPERVLTGTFDAGFKTKLLTKDVRLYMENVLAAKTPARVGREVAALWEACDAAMPETDFTEVYKFIRQADE